MTADPIATLCLKRGDLSERDLHRVLAYCGDRGLRFCSAAYQLNLLTEQRCLELLREQSGASIIALENFEPDVDAVTRLTEVLARQCLTLPLHVFKTTLVVAMSDPQDESLLSILRAETGLNIRAQQGLSVLITEKLDEVYGSSDQSLARAKVKPVDQPIGIAHWQSTGAIQLGQSPKTVAVLDSEDDSVTSYRMALDAGQFRLQMFKEGSQLLRYITATPVDAIVVGSTGFGLNALEVCRRLKGSPTTEDIPLVLVSRLIKERTWRQHPRARLADVFFEKPFDASALSKELVARVDQGARWIDVSLNDESYDSGSTSADRFAAKLNDPDSLEQIRMPSEPNACLQFGHTLEEQGSIYQALEWFEKAVHLDPNIFDSRQQLAEFYERHGYVTLAMDAWQNALMVDCTPHQAELSRAAVRRLKS